MEAHSTVCEKCPFVAMGLCGRVEECPNYCENIWRNGQTQEVKVVKDCSPKRQLIQSQHTNTRIEWLQSNIEQLTSKNEKLEASLNTLISQSQMVIRAIEQTISQDPRKITLKGDSDARSI